jgi:hypothetical protein
MRLTTTVKKKFRYAHRTQHGMERAPMNVWADDTLPLM